MTTQRLVIPLPDAPTLRLLSPNGRGHHMARNRARKTVEALVWAACREQGLLAQPTPCIMYATWVLPQARRRDGDNFTALLKGVGDSLVRCGIWPDDSLAQVQWAPVSVVVERGTRELRLHLVSVEG